MQHEIIDNFLNKEQFKKVKDKLLHHNFGWFLSQGVTERNNKNKEHYNFTHKFYEHYRINSEAFSDLLFVINKLEVKSLLRIKANLYPKTAKIIEHDFHVDYEFPHKSALYMINTNNGYTILEDGKKIETKENRMLLFDASKKHKSTTCTDNIYKCNIIFNYF
tara:strand:- start:90 stop:578 length:489 start_codon:yes stop_codon:yes gene_type:complete